MSGDGQINISLNADLADAAKTFREQKRVQQEVAESLGLTRAEYNRLTNQINKKERASRRSVASTKLNVAAQGKLTAATSSSTAATQAATMALGKMGIAANAALGPIGLIAGVLLGIGGAGINAANQMSSMVDEIANLSESTGLSQRQVLSLRHAIQGAGGDFNKTQQALSSFNKVMQDDLVGKTGPEVDAVFRSTIARIEAIEDPAGRAAERMRIFGTESAKALANLTSQSLVDADEKTRMLADAIENASAASAEMDRSATELKTSWDALTVQLGTATAPAVVAVTDALAQMNQNQAQVAVRNKELVAQGTQLEFTMHAISNPITGATSSLNMLNDAVFGATKLDREYTRALKERHARLLDVAEAQKQARLEAENMASGTSAPERREGRRAEDPKLKAARIEAAKKARLEVEAADKFVRDMFRKQDLADEISENEDRAKMKLEGERRLQAELQRDREEQAQIEADALARKQAQDAEELRMLEAKIAKENQLKQVRQDAVLAATSGLAQIIAASSDSATAIAIGRILEATAYGAVAFARSFAELGPIAGLIPALTVGTAIASQVAQVKSLPSRHMGGTAPDEGLVKVRNGERVMFEPATVNNNRNNNNPAILMIDNEAFTAMQRRADRRERVFGDRRRRAIAI